MILAAYVGVQVERMDARGWAALWLNLLGSLAILFSMTVAFNLSAALMEGAWALTAIYGMWRRLKK
jgi:hypothetical protein